MIPFLAFVWLVLFLRKQRLEESQARMQARLISESHSLSYVTVCLARSVWVFQYIYSLTSLACVERIWSHIGITTYNRNITKYCAVTTCSAQSDSVDNCPVSKAAEVGGLTGIFALAEGLINTTVVLVDGERMLDMPLLVLKLLEEEGAGVPLAEAVVEDKTTADITRAIGAVVEGAGETV